MQIEQEDILTGREGSEDLRELVVEQPVIRVLVQHVEGQASIELGRPRRLSRVDFLRQAAIKAMGHEGTVWVASDPEGLEAADVQLGSSAELLVRRSTLKFGNVLEYLSSLEVEERSFGIELSVFRSVLVDF